MLPSSFARLANTEPQLRSTFQQLAKWAQTHKDWKWIDPAIVAKDLPQIDEFALADALTRAVRRGYLAIRYTVLTPSGSLADRSFKSPREIPAQLPDRFQDYFETGNYPIVTIFEDADRRSSRNQSAHDSKSVKRFYEGGC